MERRKSSAKCYWSESMNLYNNAVRAGVLLLGLAASSAVYAQAEGVSGAEQGSEHVTVNLVPETTSAVAGETLWVALRLVHAEHWHTYWINPGDAGKVTEISWQLPEGVSAGDITWPMPERFDLPRTGAVERTREFRRD
jgi:DsbC/DsbD-like thiol-disulfide interchange protein